MRVIYYRKCNRKNDLGQLNPVLWEFAHNMITLSRWSHSNVFGKSGRRTPADGHYRIV
jgi:hypothetical protein